VFISCQIRGKRHAKLFISLECEISEVIYDESLVNTVRQPELVLIPVTGAHKIESLPEMQRTNPVTCMRPVIRNVVERAFLCFSLFNPLNPELTPIC
jgi:hypothetical protein